MRLLGKEKLQALLGDSGQTCTWVRAWSAELASAHWKDPCDVVDQFPNSREIGSGEFVFPIIESTKEVYVKIAFPQGIAIVVDIR